MAGPRTYGGRMRGGGLVASALAVCLALAAPAASARSLPELQPAAATKPSTQVIAFYYGWYGNPTFDGEWIHWNDPINKAVPPADISSDYYPQLGAYSSRDPAILRQHMAWLQRAKIGVIALSWWDGETSDALVQQLLDAAKVAGIKVTLHIEPVTGRTAASYQTNVIRLVRKFGRHPAFFKTKLGSPYLKAGSSRPLIFVWATAVKDLNGSEVVEPTYWAKANDAIHRQTGALVVACPCGGGYDRAVSEGKFDGAYNYATLHLAEEGGFTWARSLPPGALYIPSVLPGFHADRVGYDKDTVVPRRDGQEYDDQWTAALETGVTPDFVSVTSFNEWHEGSQIEPPRPDYSAGGRRYLDFLPLSPTSYIDQTASWVVKFTSGDYPKPVTNRARLRITTSSDWSSIHFGSGAVARPGKIQASREATVATFDGSTMSLSQALARAESGQSVTMTMEGLALGQSFTLIGNGGYIGQTTLTMEIWSGTSWQVAGAVTWVGGPEDDGASRTISLP